mmetsp:Transcript_3573/g.6937  ORF Transcript_3573/g.6937 Transcript_3573/m.6937 type:complete len:275 (+) Transcript_3573:1941-2765(+)
MTVGGGHTELINTVRENMEGYSRTQVQRAKLARETAKMLGFPSDDDYKWLVRTGIIKNCPITVEDISIATDIFGPDVHAIKGKTTRRQPPRVRVDRLEVPAEIYRRCQNIILVTDFMFVAGLPFLVTLSTELNLVTVEFTPRMDEDTMIKGLKKAIQVYHNKGMQVTTTIADNQFDPARGLLGTTDLNLAAAGEHVPAIERKIRTIKERFRALRSTLPFRLLPSRFIIDGIVFCTLILNAIPTRNGISDYFSPREIITSTKGRWEPSRLSMASW